MYRYLNINDLSNKPTLGKKAVGFISAAFSCKKVTFTAIKTENDNQKVSEHLFNGNVQNRNKKVNWKQVYFSSGT